MAFWWTILVFRSIPTWGPSQPSNVPSEWIGPQRRWYGISISPLAFFDDMAPLLADSLGGDLYWSAGVSLISDIPRKPHWPVKLHGFVNAGRLDALDKSERTYIDIIPRSFLV